MKTLLIAIMLVATALVAQQDVSLSVGPPQVGWSKLVYVSGSNITYICTARSTQSIPSSITVSAASNANPVSFTATAHNLGDYANLGATIIPAIKITGATGNWTPINGVWAGTTSSANAFTIAVDSSGFGALTGTLVVTTVAPRFNALVWDIQHMTYDGSSNLTSLGWASKPGGAAATSLVGGSSGAAYACSSRASYGYQ